MTDELTPEDEKKMAARLLGRQDQKSRVVETKRKRAARPPARAIPHFEIITGHDYEEFFAFWLVSDEDRVEIGREWERQGALKLQRRIERMGLRVEWVQS